MVDRYLAAALVVPFAIGVMVAPDRDAEVAFEFQDPEIVESSGLVVIDGSVVTVNDSGDSARIFVVDPATGRTTRTVTWGAEVDDVEALAPGPDGSVLVGDIGDNAGGRDTIRVWQVPLDGSAVTSYELDYPDGAQDAEALLVEPVSGQLLVATKDLFGGTLYAAPLSLSAEGPNRLEPIGSGLPLVTDGAFLPDGRHLVLRDYGRAVVYSYPDLEVVGSVNLPPQDQGEAIATVGDRTAYVSSEGQFSEVLRIELPVPAPPAAEPQVDRSADIAEPVQASGTVQLDTPLVWPWMLGGVAGALVMVVLLRSLRPR